MTPKLSIITVVYNGVDLIEGTIQSVIAQDYPNIEFVIVDGLSEDGTLDIIKKYENQIDQFVSEKDSGLYDAMNKGLDMATGDFVWFMNCGDWIYDHKTVSNIFNVLPPADVYYGECMMVDDNRIELGLRSEMTPHTLPLDLTWRSMNRGMVVSHQSFIAKKSICPKYIDDNLCADIDWVIKVLKESNGICHTKSILSQFLVGGLSRKKHKQSLKDRFKVLSEHFGFIPNIINHLTIIIRSFYHNNFVRRNQSKY